MKAFLKNIASVLLFLNGVGALYGGLNLIAHPDGSSLQMPLYYLDHPPFRDFLAPGIILLITNGLFSLFVLAVLFFDGEKYPWLVVAQGTILTGWIVIQCLMLQVINSLQVMYGSIGLLLIACGTTILLGNSGEWKGFKPSLKSRKSKLT